MIFENHEQYLKTLNTLLEKYNLPLLAFIINSKDEKFTLDELEDFEYLENKIQIWLEIGIK